LDLASALAADGIDQEEGSALAQARVALFLYQETELLASRDNDFGTAARGCANDDLCFEMAVSDATTDEVEQLGQCRLGRVAILLEVRHTAL
jgi:hypothetical protein